ncbi:MAG: hypothetical protein ACE5IW_01135 [bacterium]
MEKILGYIIFGVGWPVLIIGSIWAWRKIASLSGQSQTFLNVALLTFYVLNHLFRKEYINEQQCLLGTRAGD